MMRMRRRLNFKWAAILTLVVAVLGGSVHLVHGYQVRRNARALLARGLKAEKAGDFGKAAGYLQRYLGFVPGDDEALIRYGQVLDRHARSPRERLQPFLVLEQALRRQPGRHDLRRRLVEIAMEIGRFPDARIHIEALLKGSAADDAALERQLARCYAGEGNDTKADGWLEKAIGHQPDLVDGYVELAELRRNRLGQSKQADAVMDALVEKNDASFRAHLARWRYRTAYQLGGAEEDLAQARALAPEEADVLLAAAEVAERRGDSGEARTLLERALQLHPGDGRTYQALAAVELRAGRPEAAEAVLSRGIKALPDQLDLLWTLAEVQIDLGRLAEAQGSIDRLNQSKVAPAPPGFLTAALRARQGKWSEAAQLMEQVRPRLASWPEMTWRADLMLGQFFERLGKPDQQLVAYRRAVDARPLDVVGRLGLARALIAIGRPDQALEEYQKIVPPVPEARLGEARLVIIRNLRLPAEQRRWEEAERLLDEAARVAPKSMEVPMLRAEVLIAQGRPDDARGLLQRLRDQDPARAEPWVALAELAGRQEGPAATLHLLDEAQDRLGDGVDMRLARARSRIQQGGPEVSKALEALAGDLDKIPVADRPRLLRGLALLALRAGATAEARTLWGRLAQERPEDAEARLILFTLALQANDPAASQLLDDLRRADGDDGTLWRFGHARLLTRQAARGDTRALGEARALLRAVAERRPFLSDVPLAQAAVEEQAGDPAEAIRNYLRAIELGEVAPEVIRRTAQLLVERNRYAEADQVVRKLQFQSAPLPVDLQRLAVDLSLRTQDLTRAVELAHKAVADRPDDYRDQMWLGQVLWSAGQKAEAESPLRRAVALAPGQPDSWMSLVRYLALSGRKPDAEAAIEEARAALPADGSRLVLGLCYQMVGRLDLAEQSYREELAAKPDDAPALRSLASFYLASGRPGDADPHLHQLIALAARLPEDAAWARRTRAKVLIAGGRYPGLREALGLMGLTEDGRATATATAEDRRVQIAVLAAQPDRRLRREAIRLLEELGQGEPLAADDQFLLAGLYQADGAWPKTRQLMLDLLASHGQDVRYLVSYVNGLLRQHRGEEVQLWFDKLEALKPQPLAAADLALIKARLLVERGRKDEAAALLKAQAGTDPNRLLASAAVLDGLGVEAAAEEMYRAYAARAKPPEVSLVLAQYLGRHGRTPEALDLCERAWSTCPPEAVGRTSVAVLDADPSADDSQRQHVERRLEAAVREHPDSTSLVVSLAILRNIQERYREAETLYRQVLARDRRDFVALNNLAWLLALKQAKGTEALDLIREAIELVGPLPDLRDTRALAYLTLGQGDRAVEDLEEAVAASPAPRTYFHLARAHQLVGNRVAAAAALQQAQAGGLAADNLHPLERPAYQQLRTELARQ